MGDTSVLNSISGVTASALTDTTSTPIIAAQGASVAVHLTNIIVTNGNASTMTEVQILNGTTLKWTAHASVNGGGFAVSFPPDAPLLGAANTAWNVKCATTGATVLASLSGKKSVLR